MFAGIDWRALRKYKKLKKKMTNQSDQSRGHASKLAREMRHNARQSDDNKQREMKEQHSGIVEWLHSYFSSAILEIRPTLYRIMNNTTRKCYTEALIWMVEHKGFLLRFQI